MIRGALALCVTLAVAPAIAETFTIEGSCRDGRAHGAYELRGVAGQVRAVGAFNRGKRMGSFLFWSAGGVRIAHLPYDEDVLSGTLAVWYPDGGRSAEPRPKQESTYVSGKLSGTARSWHPNGRVRAVFRYESGVLVEARAFGETGVALPEVDARKLAARDRDDEVRFVASLEAIVRANAPTCDPASDRLEKS